MADDRTLDVRTLIPRERHKQIFATIDSLAAGGSLTITNDHDPKPLHYQLDAEYPNQFSWTYLESGPEVWRVKIAKLASA